jgi:uncharacterized protein YbaA (DUF1428 family)
MRYVDGFVIPVPEGNNDAFIAMARTSAAIFRDHGAIRIVECWGDDVPDGKVTDFRRSVAAEPGERVVFAWIEWPSKEAREEGMRRVMADERSKAMGDMPFDGKRMIFGGFAVVLDEPAR